MKRFVKSMITVLLFGVFVMPALIFAEKPQTALGALDPIPYINENGEEKTVLMYKEVSSSTSLLDGTGLVSWYVAKGTVSISNLITVTGDVHLILCDDATLTANKGINVESSGKLSIYAQSAENKGKLVAKGEEEQAGIGGGNNKDAGTISIYGSTIEATGGKFGAGIGGGDEGDGGMITIAGGAVTATGGTGAAGIGGGDLGDGGKINITGGTINLAKGTDGTNESGGGAGIGGGNKGDGGMILISGGTIVEAQGAKSGAGIGGGNEGDGGIITITGGAIPKTAGEINGGGNEGDGEIITITGGTIQNTSGGINGAGIGGGYQGNGGTITISGGTIQKAYGGISGAGIGGGYQGNGGTITISGGELNKIHGGNGEGRNKSDSKGGAGIGGGGSAISGTITIKGNAHIKEILSGYNGAGIGGGFNGNGETIVIDGKPMLDSVESMYFGAAIGSGGYSDLSGNITIKGGSINAKAKYYGAAIGGGYASECGEIRISGGTINAEGPVCIGSGCNLKKENGETSGDIQISGGTITAKNSNYYGDGACIGGGQYNSAKKITISGGNITAISKSGGAAIGGGLNGDGGEITISGGEITADSFVSGAAAIGGGSAGNGGTILITGGTIIRALSEEGAGIGGGIGGSGGKITIKGGTIMEARSEHYSAAIGGGQRCDGGTIRILGGTIKMASGGELATGIGGGVFASGGNILITGNASVVAKGGDQAPGIGGGAGDLEEPGGSCGKITISGSDGQKPQVIAYGGTYAAGIGSGAFRKPQDGEINISDGTVTAYGSDYAAGIGSGAFRKTQDGEINISDGTVTAYGSDYAAGIGGSRDCNGGSINISGGTVTSKGGFEAAGIGGGENASSGRIRITGGEVIAEGSSAGIGCGSNYDTSLDTFDGLWLGYDDNTKAGMSVTASSYKCNVTVLTEKAFTDGYSTGGKLNVYKGTLSEDEKTTIAGRTIVPSDETTFISGATYLDLDGKTKGPVRCEVISNNTTDLKGDNSTKGWYMVTGSVYPGNLSKMLAVSGQVNLILCDGAEMNGLISVNGGSLTVWAQGTGEMMGKLTADASVSSLSDESGISGNGDLIINGGMVSAKGNNSLGINLNGSMTANHGTITAEGVDHAINVSTITFGNMAVYDSAEATVVPVNAANRETTCLNNQYVKITPCGTDECPHGIDRTAGKCRYCSVQYGNKVTLQVNPAEKGTIKAKVGKEETEYKGSFYAVEDEIIHLVVDSSPDSVLKDITVVTASGKSVKVESDKSFTMPAEPVTVTAELATLNDIIKSITPADLSGGDVKVWVNEKESSQAVTGATVRLEVNPATDYSLKTLLVRKKDSINSNDHIPVKDNSFLMPDFPVTVEAVFEQKTHEEQTEIESDDNGNKGNATAAVKKGYTTLAKITTSGKKAAVLTWDAVTGAAGYDILFAKCAKGTKYKKVASLKSSVRKYKFKGLKKGTCYKALVKAWKKTNGKKIYIGKSSPSVHLIAGGYNKKECNAKSIKLNKKSLTLAKGKKATLKAKVKLVKRGRKLLKHVKAVRWFSSNTKVAKVNSKGKVTAAGSGTCTIYAIVHSGKKAAAKITVK